MTKLTEHQRALGISIKPGKFLACLICLNDSPVDAAANDSAANTIIGFLELYLDAFLKSSAFESAASEWARTQGWHDPDGN